jgi:threonine dehydrogenase-like Zn-dependent dehydrogenase
MIGQAAIQVFKGQGVAKVIASEVSPRRLEAARVSGADVLVNPRETDAVKAVEAATEGNLADIVVECTGSPVAFYQAIEMVRGGGKIMQVGLFERKVELDPNLLMKKNIMLRGCLGANIPAAIELLQKGVVKVKHLITHEFALQEAPKAFATQARAEESIKVMIRP